MSQFGEPWNVGEVTTDSPCSNASIDVSEFQSIHVKGHGFRSPDADETAHRIVACVNFCRQFPTEFLEPRQLLYLKPGDSIGRSCDQLPGFYGKMAVVLNAEFKNVLRNGP